MSGDFYNYQEELDREDEHQDQQEKYEDDIEEQKRGGYEHPQPKESESLYNLFHKVLELEDSSKVGNLDKAELGLLNINVREAQRIELLAKQFGHYKFGEYFRKVGEIILRTSASKKGWFTELFVSQKKSALRVAGVQQPEPNREKKGWSFGKK
jgi:hypothetical protein